MASFLCLSCLGMSQSQISYSTSSVNYLMKVASNSSIITVLYASKLTSMYVFANPVYIASCCKSFATITAAAFRDIWKKSLTVQ